MTFFAKSTLALSLLGALSASPSFAACEGEQGPSSYYVEPEYHVVAPSYVDYDEVPHCWSRVVIVGYTHCNGYDRPIYRRVSQCR